MKPTLTAASPTSATMAQMTSVCPAHPHHEHVIDGLLYLCKGIEPDLQSQCDKTGVLGFVGNCCQQLRSSFTTLGMPAAMFLHEIEIPRKKIMRLVTAQDFQCFCNSFHLLSTRL